MWIHSRSLLCPLFFLALLLPLSVRAQAQAGTSGCGACEGDADANASSPNAACPGAAVTISVTVQSRACVRIELWPYGYSCAPNELGCSVSIYRSWTNVAPGMPMMFCRVEPGQPRYCQDSDPATPGNQGPSSGSGFGSNTESGSLSCRSTGEDTVYYVSASCGTIPEVGPPPGVTATAAANCTRRCLPGSDE